MAFMLPRKRFFYITSGTQLSETVSTFSVELQIPDSEEYDRIVLTQCLIPLSYYTVSAGQNTFVLNENGSTVTISIPPGNYNTTNFPIEIVSLLNEYSPNGYIYTISYPDETKVTQTGKFTYGVNVNTPVSFIFPSSSDLAIRFGFNIGSTIAFTPNGSVGLLISSNVVDFTAINAILIHSNLVQDSYTDVLQDIYPANNNELATNISYLCPDPLAYSKKLSSSKIRYASFSLTDEFNNPIFLNGLDVVITIMLYKEPDFFKRVEAYVKYKMTKDITVPEFQNL